MQSAPSYRGEMSQVEGMSPEHRKSVPRIDAAARASKSAYNALSASAVGLELGASVLIGLFFGRWLDGKVGTEPWLMIVFLALGFAAGIRGVIRGVRRAERAVEEEAGHG